MEELAMQKLREAVEQVEGFQERLADNIETFENDEDAREYAAFISIVLEEVDFLEFLLWSNKRINEKEKADG